MTIEINVEKLKAQKGELEEQLQRINGLIALAEQFASVQMPVAPQQLALPVHQVTSNNNDKPRGFTPGLRRAVIMALHTGPTAEADVAKALAWEFARTKQVIQSMLKFRICYLNEHGRLVLTDEGKKQAAWYLAHPNCLTYRPGGYTNVSRTAQGPDNYNS